MAQQHVMLEEEKFFCSICKDLPKFPVSLLCGHSYCMNCIEQHWVGHRKRVKCPQCKQAFMPRPVLKKNNQLAEVVAIIKKTQLDAVLPDHFYAGPGDVACDPCTKRKLKAVETCLQCLVSYCDTHLQPHHQSPAFKNHKLVKVSRKIHGDICIQRKIQDTEEEVRLLQQEVGTINASADTAARNSDDIFAELIRSVERRRSEVREQIRDQQRHEVSRTQEQRKRVEQAITELRGRHAELEQLSHAEDPNHVPHTSTSLSRVSEYTHPISSIKYPLKHFDEVPVAVSKMRGKLEDVLKEEETNVSNAVNRADVLLSTPEPKTRAEFLKYALNVTMDPNTAHNYLVLSAGNLKVMNTNKIQSHPAHPDRWDDCWQVLGTEALTGRHYWEAEWGGDYVDIAASYPDNPRSGNTERRFGLNLYSWCVQCWGEAAFFRFNTIGKEIPIPVRSRVGVYLDHPAGILSWYSVSDTMTLLHRVETIFTRPIYPGFWVCDGATMEMCHDLK